MTNAAKPPAGRSKGRRWRRIFFVALGLGIAVAAVLLPGLMRARIASNETAAIGTLRTLSTSQAQFQSAAIVDQDGDGVGEFGFFAELAGSAPYRVPGGVSESPVTPAFCASVLGRTAVAKDGIASKSGYHYRMYLPTAAGEVTADPGRPQPGRAGDADVQEVRYVLYAWPIRRGTTGNRAFVISQQGEVFSTSNGDAQAYDGRHKMPAPGAAFTASAGEEPRNAEGQFVTGTPAGDGHTWLPAG